MDEKDFFASEADQWVYYLINLEGKQRMKKCGISMIHYASQTKAKTWFDKVHERIQGHSMYEEAYAELKDIYGNMVDKGDN